jgi:DMSO/TMAO reductase YedYZ molybdopterin-dependent catalytic subunit
MDIISRGFSGRRSAADVKLPPGQYLTTDFPVLSAGPTPHVSLERWEFVIDDSTNFAEMGLEGVSRFAYRDLCG